MCKLHSTERAKRQARKPVAILSKSSVPSGGWTHENFVGRRRRQLNRDIVDVHRLAYLHGSRLLAGKFEKLFTDQIEAIIEGALRRADIMYGIKPGAFNLSLPEDVHETLWAVSIENELQAGELLTSNLLAPVAQEVADRAYEQVSRLLGSRGGKSLGKAFFGPDWLRRIGEAVTGITETTRQRLRKVIQAALRKGKNPIEVAEEVRDKIPKIAKNRVPTIVRTEMGRAADKGTSTAMKRAKNVTHISVVGCEAIEKRGPKFRGIPTCNIQNVPVEFEGEVSFHPNHTGTWIVSGFRKSDGSVPDLPLRRGTAAEEH